MLRSGLCYKVGTGREINALRDPWVYSIPGFKPIPRAGALSEQEQLMVRDLMTLDDRRWNEQKVPQIFNQKMSVAILQIRLSANEHPDKYLWLLDPTSDFSIKSVYRLMVAGRDMGMSPLQQNRWGEGGSYDLISLLLVPDPLVIGG